MTSHEREDALALLMAAKLHLEEFGWKQHSYGKPGRPCCGMGALYAVEPRELCSGSGLARQAIHSAVLPDIWGMVSFNDVKGRTKAQVLRKFDEAIAFLERES